MVLHRETDADAVRAAVVESAGVPVSGLTVTHFDVFRAQLQPTWFGLGALERCETPAATGESLDGLIKSAEGSFMYMELDKASGALSEAKASLGCLSEPVDPALAARIQRAAPASSVAEADGRRPGGNGGAAALRHRQVLGARLLDGVDGVGLECDPVHSRGLRGWTSARGGLIGVNAAAGYRAGCSACARAAWGVAVCSCVR